MKELLAAYRHYGSRRDYYAHFTYTFPLFIAGLAANTYAIGFATDHASNSVTDLVLSNTPVFNVASLFVYGTFVVAVISILIAFSHPKRIPFMVGAVGLFFVIRSIFVMLTHVAPFEAHYTYDFGERITNMFFGADQFFSGHTGLPFLGALAFWGIPKLRYFFLGSSLFFALIVLLGHLHYSIDVASAFFITYGIFHIAIWLFPGAFRLFMAEDDAI